jgi:ABC-type cobalamin/Fe3+-siderophores transport system ATPase subunit
MSDPRPAPIVARNLRLAYPRGPVVIESEEITVASGALVSLVGPNGSGKTTLLRSIAGLLPPRDGTILVAGSRMYGRHAVPRRERARLLSVVLTDRVTPAYLLVKELVSLGRSPSRAFSEEPHPATATPSPGRWRRPGLPISPSVRLDVSATVSASG